MRPFPPAASDPCALTRSLSARPRRRSTAPRVSGALALAIAAGLALALAPAEPAGAQGDPREQADRPSTSAVSVITREEIANRQWRTLADVLRAQPGVHLSQIGGRGQDTLLFLRGNSSGSVLVRLDGIDVSDPGANPLGLVNDPGARSAGQIVPDLLTENIESIRIVRGVQGARYGSDAIGGVIEIETRRGSGSLSPWASFEIGGFGTTQQAVGVSGGSERFGYALSYTNANTRGITATPERLGSKERDGNQNDTVSARLDLVPTDRLSFTLTGRLIDEDVDLDPAPSLVTSLLDASFDTAVNLGGGPGRLIPEVIGVDPGGRGLVGSRRRLYLGSEARLGLLGDRWVQTFAVRFSDHDVRDTFDDLEQQSLRQPVAILLTSGVLQQDQGFSQVDRAGRDGRRITFDWRNEIRVLPEHTLVFGLETERESVDRTTIAIDATDASQRFVPDPGSPPDPLIDLLLPAIDVTLTQAVRTRQHRSLRNNSVYLGDRFEYDAVYGELDLRLHDHDDYGSGLTYRAALGYLDPNSKLRVYASVGTAFRDPDVLPSANLAASLQRTVQSSGPVALPAGFPLDLTATLPGDASLDRAVSRGVELGFDLPLLDEALRLGGSLFQSRVRGLSASSLLLAASPGLVGFGGEPGLPLVASLPDDSIEERTRGFEIAATWIPFERTTLSVDYTRTESELRHTPPALATADLALAQVIVPLVPPGGSDLPGIPRDLVHVSLDSEPVDGLVLSFSTRYVGKRKANRLIASETLGGYTLYGVAARYRLFEQVEVYGRIENLFDKDYEDLGVAEQPGIAGYVGVRAEL